MTPAEKAIHDSRQAVYGEAKTNMRGTSKQIEGLFINWQNNNPDKPLPEWFAPLVMCAVKMNRIASGNYTEDNFTDLRVYLTFVEEMQRAESGEEK